MERNKGKRGRRKSDKKLVLVTLELLEGDVRRAYAPCISIASTSTFRRFFATYISKDAKIITDEWIGYIPLKKNI
ncbi:MAG: transposase [Lutibacter sp.]|nr:transposase [Lutibacter sp.]